MEGVGQEASSLAGHRGLGHLNVLYDCYRIANDGDTALSFAEDTGARFKAMGWHVLETYGQKRPSPFVLSRLETPQVRVAAGGENQTAKGGYVLHEPEGPRDITLIATGTEVTIALQAAERLHLDDIHAAVVSLPCWSLFDTQPYNHRGDVLRTALRLAVEAASPFGWIRYVACETRAIGVPHYGASASAEEL